MVARSALQRLARDGRASFRVTSRNLLITLSILKQPAKKMSVSWGIRRSRSAKSESFVCFFFVFHSVKHTEMRERRRQHSTRWIDRKLVDRSFSFCLNITRSAICHGSNACVSASLIASLRQRDANEMLTGPRPFLNAFRPPLLFLLHPRFSAIRRRETPLKPLSLSGRFGGRGAPRALCSGDSNGL
jgi:hypothetical protein